MSAHLRHNPALRGPVATATVEKALSAIDASRVVPLLELWEEQDRTQVGGRKSYLTFRATLALWLILSMEHQPMHIKRVAQLLRERMTPKTCAALGITFDPRAAPNAMYERARVATNRINKLMDAFPLKTRQRRLTVAELNIELESRAANHELLERRRNRAHIFRNQLMEVTYQMLPEQYRPETVSVVVDATRIPTYARGIGKDRLAALSSDAKVSAEPDYAFYQRSWKGKSAGDNAVAEGKPERKHDQIRISEYAAEHEFAVLCSNDPLVPDAVPNLIIALQNHLPAVGPIEAARSMVDSLYERGHKIEHFTGDRAYLSVGDPDTLANHLRDNGAKILMDYTKNGLGIKDQKLGAVLIEGNWYCPSMPDVLKNATIEYRKIADPIFGKRDPSSARTRAEAHDVWKQRIRARESYLFRPKENADERGRIPFMCPAAGPAPTRQCALKPNPRATTRELLNISPVPKHPGKVCTNKTSTSFHINDGGKFAQHYQYGSDEWERTYRHMRNQVESINKFAKDDSTFAIARPERRRMRGYTAQSTLITLTIVAINLELIRTFLLERDERTEEAIDGVASPKSKSNRSRRSTPEIRNAARKRNRKSPATGAPPRNRTQNDVTRT